MLIFGLQQAMQPAAEPVSQQAQQRTYGLTASQQTHHLLTASQQAHKSFPGLDGQPAGTAEPTLQACAVAAASAAHLWEVDGPIAIGVHFVDHVLQ